MLLLQKYWKQIALLLAFIAVLGYAKVQTSRLHAAQKDLATEQVKNLDLEAKIKLQNDAIDQLKVDADKRKAEGEVIIEAAKKEAESHQQKAAQISTRAPIGDDCKAALMLGNSK